MISFKQYIILLLICITIGINSFAQEFRTGINYESEVIPHLELEGKAEFRTFFLGDRQYYGIFQVGAGYGFLDHFSIGGTIRQSITSELKGFELDDPFLSEINEQTRFTGDFKYKTKRFKNDLRISNRLRYQYSLVDKDNNRSYVRNKTSLDYKLNKRTRPYLALELYWYIEKNEMRKVRVYIGNKLEIAKQNFEIAYIIEANLTKDNASTFYMLGVYYSL